MATKRKLGRPATGHDPTITIRVPREYIAKVEDFVSYMGGDGVRPYSRSKVTASDIWREALRIGLDVIHGEAPERGYHLPELLRPRHDAEIHEAGHAVAVFLAAEAVGLDPADCLISLKLKPRRGGLTLHAPFPPLHTLRIIVAGAVAESLEAGKTFGEVWSAPGCGGDRRQAAKLIREHGRDLDDAIDYVKSHFDQRPVWSGLVAVARMIPQTNSSVFDGRDYWNIYKAAFDIEAQSLRKKRRRPSRIDWAVSLK